MIAAICRVPTSSAAIVLRLLRLRNAFLVASVIVVILAIDSCTSQTSPPNGAGNVDATSGHTSAATPSLSKRNVGPLVVESVKSEFWEDYSFVTSSDTPPTSQSLATTNRISPYGPTPPPVRPVIANSEWIVLTVAGNSSSPITINEMQVVKSCRKPLPGGTLFYSPTTGAGPFSVAQIYYNLDSSDPIGQYLPAPGDTLPPGGNFFAKEVITLRYQEPQTLGVFVRSSQYCQFTLNLNIATTSGQVSETIDNNGQPFAITSDGEITTPGRVPFSSYSVVYAGGFADHQNGGRFMRVNPEAYHGTGDPATFPAH